LPELPIGHPADGDWRFVPLATAGLLDAAVRGLKHGAGVLHLGTHSTFRLALEVYPQFRHVLLDRNAAVVHSLTPALSPPHAAFCADLRDGIVAGLSMQCAILDPPWYLNDTLAFLGAAAESCVVGARILLCQPTPATRPGIEAERAELLRQLPSIGLALDDVLSGFVRYRMPHFEAMSIRAAMPMVEVPGDWRCGDVMVLTKQEAVHSQVLRVREIDDDWAEARFGPVRIKLRVSRGGRGDLEEIIEGSRLTTVSRRDPMRAQIGFWTSGNRVYTLRNVKKIEDLVNACNDDLHRMRFGHAGTIERAATMGIPRPVAERLFDVLILELQEHWLMGRCK
jgi:hypothetical protein